ncbi:hypothetical protein DRI50_00760 [candidate division KSB1 bacterium]|nr:MAG: hypothetical protein DRI50_00760 [candidate division KSB1 bacterium]
MKLLKQRPHNYYPFLWHGFWLAFTSAFTDYNTVLPAMIVRAGGTSFHIGLLTFISIGFPLLSRLIFTPFISSRQAKRPYLILGISMRIAALAGLGFTIYLFTSATSLQIIYLIYFWMLLFTVSGAFAGLSYTHLVGVSFTGDERKHFLVTRQFLSALALAFSAYLARLILKHGTFPNNYMVLFFMASIFIFIASLGFWALREPPEKRTSATFTILQLLQKIPGLLREDTNLRYLILTANSLSASLILIPFLTNSLKHHFTLSGKLVGNLILFQYLGMIISNYIWRRVSKKHGFKGLLKIAIVMISLSPIFGILILFFNSEPLLFLLFFYLGSAISVYKIAMEGTLLEITTDENRVLYSGVYGLMNIIGAFLPLFIGIIFHLINQNILFVAFGLFTLSSLFYLKRMHYPVNLEKIQ